MTKLLHIHYELLELAAAAEKGPRLPAPESIGPAVDLLIQRGLLLADDEGRIAITDAGHAALLAPEKPDPIATHDDGAVAVPPQELCSEESPSADSA